MSSNLEIQLSNNTSMVVLTPRNSDIITFSISQTVMSLLEEPPKLLQLQVNLTITEYRNLKISLPVIDEVLKYSDRVCYPLK